MNNSNKSIGPNFIVQYIYSKAGGQFRIVTLNEGGEGHLVAKESTLVLYPVCEHSCQVKYTLRAI